MVQRHLIDGETKNGEWYGKVTKDVKCDPENTCHVNLIEGAHYVKDSLRGSLVGHYETEGC